MDAPSPEERAAEAELDRFDFTLPPEQIAQEPPSERDGGRLLVLAREGGVEAHAKVVELPRWLRAGDLLVVNTTRVLRARLRGRKESGGAAEALLLGAEGGGAFRALVRCRGRLREGQKFTFERGSERVDAEITARHENGEVRLVFAAGADPYALGEMPLPPYIERTRADARDEERYQTVFAEAPGAVAAPTAGLHLSPALLAELAQRGVERASVTLHVGAGTFRPIGARELGEGRLHEERFVLPETTAEAIARTRAAGGRVIAVGTTVTRVLESQADGRGGVRAGSGTTDLFLRPGDAFSVVDGLLTNFHLPRSSLLMLVAAFCGRKRILSAYAEAVTGGYRFFSYGDAMFILPCRGEAPA